MKKSYLAGLPDGRPLPFTDSSWAAFRTGQLLNEIAFFGSQGYLMGDPSCIRDTRKLFDELAVSINMLHLERGGPDLKGDVLRERDELAELMEDPQHGEDQWKLCEMLQDIGRSRGVLRRNR
jgi:hypothetical protein